MDWPTVTLSEVAEINPRLPKETRSQSEMDVAFLQMASVSEQGKILDVELRKLEDVVKGFTYFAQGDVIVAKITPCMENGKAAFIDHRIPTEIGFGSTEFHVIRPGPELHGKYLFHLIWSDKFRFIAEKNMTGTAGQKRVPTSFIQRYKFQLPPLDEQEKIAAILDKADEISNESAKARILRKDVVQSLFYDMFGDPVANPMDWDIQVLGDFCGVGSSKRVFKNELVEDGIPFYRGTEIGKLGNGEKITPSLFITNQHYETLKEHSGVPKIGDLLMPSICPDGRIFTVTNDSPFYFKDGRVLWIKVNQSIINSTFMRYLLKAIFYSNYENIASGTTFAELKIFALKKMTLPLPPIQLQNKFANTLELIQKIPTTEVLVETNSNSLAQHLLS